LQEGIEVIWNLVQVVERIESHHVLPDAEIAGAIARPAQVDVSKPVGELSLVVKATHYSPAS